ncbi:hypothetical protein RZS08_64000, partial [Arthrospira platensis SPKY1]|nr:hypothetical protein [Arthrospira platensis SPKY1]
QVLAPSRVTVETDGIRGDTTLKLFGPNDSTRQIAENKDRSDSSTFSEIVSFLGPGTYWASVIASDPLAIIDSYIIGVTAVPLQELGDDDDTPEKANPLVA